MIQFLYFEGCPNANATLNNLKQAMEELQIPPDKLEIVDVDFDLATKHSFQGSPTILIDGIDIYTNSKPDSVHYTCRMYVFNNIRTGIIPLDYIKQKLQQYLYC